ncbi:filamin-binding LIM protein 1 isoform X2 [Austrofundulus limnaeus]|uniref:Filamin-binding LIM protein 1 isoform X2 n=1 Tax=Austrofundulus limnaeus TaxID=52670 RepID=A0A2I4B247_AUSLI|nr:PREDICTED: filamin-binding LIM protein 1 isoform X2 [Austrofundulus limnaeus]
MASAATPKRMVSSVFITLASPHRATVTQQQPALQAHSASGRERSVSQGDGVPVHTPTKLDQSSSDARSSANSKNWTPGTPVSDPQSSQLVQTGSTKAKLREDQKQRISPELFPPPDELPASLKGKLSEESSLPPPPPSFPPPPSSLHPQSPNQHPTSNKKVETCIPSNGSTQSEEICEIHKNGQEMQAQSKDVCGFCRKPVALSEPALEALNRTYHEGCFQCRSCHIPLAGKQYYNKAGIPLCESCYQASLELCWACGEAITDQIIRALERAYHLSCFTCKTCKQQIGEQTFAQGEVGEVYCLQDYYKKYAPKCSSCNQLIIPKEDGTDSYTVECFGRSYHENCYRCEVCIIQLSPEPNEHGCYPYDGKMLCKSCHLNLVSGQQ